MSKILFISFSITICAPALVTSSNQIIIATKNQEKNNNLKQKYEEEIEWTSLSITPKFTKISLSLTQSRFVTNTYSIAKNVVNIYNKNKKEISSSFDVKTKQLVENLSSIQQSNNYLNSDNDDLKLKDKEENFIKMYGEMLN